MERKIRIHHQQRSHPLNVGKASALKVATSSSWHIEKPEDIDHYISRLKEKILAEFDEETILQIEF